MKNQIFQILLILTGTLFFVSGSAFAQQDSTKLKQEVEVTKAYRPQVQAAEKINDIPKVVNDAVVTPTFEYSIFSKPVQSDVEIAPVPAAKMVGEPKPELGLGLLKLGMGNYLTPYGEFFLNSKPDKNSTFGMHFNHLSSSGKLKLLNDDKVKAPESVNSAEIFGQKFLRGATLSVNLGYDRKAFTYYGYAGDKLTSDEKARMIPYFGQKQYLSKGTLSFDLQSDNRTGYDMSYDFSGNFHYLTTRTGQSESQTIIAGDLSKKFDKMFGFLKFSVTHFAADSIWNRVKLAYGRKQQLLIDVNPSVKWAGDLAGFQVGLNSTLVFDDDQSASMKIWPQVKAHWSPVPGGLTLYATIDGHLQHNTYSAVAAENPYVDPYHDVANTNYKYVLSGGLRGRVGAKTSFVGQASWSKIADQHFFITESENFFYQGIQAKTLNNTFSWLYDDLNMLKLTGDVVYSVSENLSLHLLGNYYSYDTKVQPNAWQMPDYDLTFSGIYKPTADLSFTTTILLIGSRPALILDRSFLSSSSSPVSHEFTLDPIIDLNAGIAYQFSKPLSIFARVNNFGFQKYEQWLGYTSKSFNWLAGITYSF